MSDEPVIKYGVGDRVYAEGYGTGTISYVDYDDPYVAYSILFDGKDYTLWVDTEAVSLVDERVILTGEQAERVREALEALGWDRDDLGPLAAPEKPRTDIHVKITVAQDVAEKALGEIKALVLNWGGVIEVNA